MSKLLNFIPGGIEVKLIILGIITAIISGGVFYVWHLHHSVQTLKVEKVQLKQDVANKTDTITEDDRRKSVADDIDKIMAQKRQQNEKVYETKITKIDKQVSAGRDKPVGTLLQDYFNNDQ